MWLWDGESYCDHCVPKGSKLHKLASTNDVLKEQMPFGLWEVMRINLWMIALAAAISFLFFACIAWFVVAAATVGEIFSILSILALLCTGVSAMFYCAIGLGYLINRPTTVVGSGILSIKSMTYSHDFPIDEFAWYEGTVDYGTYRPMKGLLPHCNALILEVQKGGIEVLRTRIVVGMTPETREIWREFLAVAGVPQKQSPWEKPWW